MTVQLRDDPLEAWVDESNRRCAAKGFLSGRFPAMRANYGTVRAIEELMKTPLQRTPLRRLKRAELLQWSLEACVLEFPDRFEKNIVEAARFRYEHVDDTTLD